MGGRNLCFAESHRFTAFPNFSVPVLFLKYLSLAWNYPLLPVLNAAEKAQAFDRCVNILPKEKGPKHSACLKAWLFRALRP